MFKKLFKNNKKKNYPEKNVMVAALLVHAAKIDQNYTNIERKIIERALCKFAQITEKKSKEISFNNQLTILCKYRSPIHIMCIL